MDWIDLAVLAIIVISGLRGWSVGALRQIGRFLGRLVGLVLGFTFAPRLSALTAHNVARPVVAAVMVIAASWLLGWLGYWLAWRIAEVAHETHWGPIDRGAGALISVAGSVAICWFVAAVLSVASWGIVAQQVAQSLAVKVMNQALPAPPSVVSRIEALVSSSHVPSLVAGLIGPQVPSHLQIYLSPVLHDVANSSIVRVAGLGGCDVNAVGSGVYIAPGEIVTAAHIVAGHTAVQVNGVVSTVVGFDPRSDVAIVRVPGPSGTIRAISAVVDSGSTGTIVGYASLSDLASSPAEVASQLNVVSRGINAGPLQPRSVVLVVTRVDTREAGSALLIGGSLAGLVIEPAADSNHVAYAVPALQLRRDILASSTHAVRTGSCVS